MRSERRFPKGTTYQNWVQYKEKQKKVERLIIRRWVLLPDGKRVNERLPSKDFKQFLDDPDELEKFIIRLNGSVAPEDRIRQKIILRHAYIDEKLLDNYRDAVLARLPNRYGLSKEWNYLIKYFLNFFIHKMNLENPLEWHLNQPTWSWALLNKFPKDKRSEQKKYALWDSPEHYPSEKTLREIVMIANRFMAWLHQRRPLDAKPLVFEPISRAQYKDLTATRKRLNIEDAGVFVPDADWKIIEKNLPDQLQPYAKLAYTFGLRRSETLGATLDHVMEDNLQVVQQLVGISIDKKTQPGCKKGEPRYGNLKGRLSRKVPYWFSTPEETYALIDKVFTCNLLIHPDTLSGQWTEFMESLGMDYGLHDLRHTFITKAAMRPGASPGEVMLAAGHENMETTMKYFHDSRELSEKRFVPKFRRAA